MLIMQVVETLRHLIFRHTINGEYIDIHAAKISQVSMLYDCGLSILYLGKGLRIIFIVLGTDHLITLRQPLLAVLYQQVIVTRGIQISASSSQGIKPLWRTAPSCVPA